MNIHIGELIAWGRGAQAAQYPTTISITEEGVSIRAQHRKGAFAEFQARWDLITNRPSLVSDAIHAVNRSLQQRERAGEF